MTFQHTNHYVFSTANGFIFTIIWKMLLSACDPQDPQDPQDPRGMLLPDCVTTTSSAFFIALQLSEANENTLFSKDSAILDIALPLNVAVPSLSRSVSQKNTAWISLYKAECLYIEFCHFINYLQLRQDKLFRIKVLIYKFGDPFCHEQKLWKESLSIIERGYYFLRWMMRRRNEIGGSNRKESGDFYVKHLYSCPLLRALPTEWLFLLIRTYDNSWTNHFVGISSFRPIVSHRSPWKRMWETCFCLWQTLQTF